MVVTRNQSKHVTDPTVEPVPPRVVHSPPAMPCSSTQAPGPSRDIVMFRTDDRGDSRTVASQQEPCPLPTSPSPHAGTSHKVKTHSHSTSSSATLAKKLAVKAEYQRRKLEQERTLLEHERRLVVLQQKTEEMELKAKLAALDARSDSNRSRACSSNSSQRAQERVVTWVGNQTVPDSLRPCPPVSTHKTVSQDPVTQLTAAIATLPDRIKRSELIFFSGDLNEWLAFKCSYERTKIFFTPADNLARLTTAVRGAAKVAISSILWTATDPEEIMTALEQNYARPELLVAHEIAGLRNVKVSSGPEELNTLANKLRNCVATIKLLSQHEYLSSIELFRTVLLKLSEHTRDRFTDFAATHKPFEPSVTKLELLSRFLVIEAQRQLTYNFVADVASSSTRQVSSYKSLAPKDQVHATSSDEMVHAVTSTSKAVVCTYCKQKRVQESHSVLTCKSFLSLSVDDRWRWVKESKTCYRCLKSNPHRWNYCRAKHCGLNGCDRWHHKLLHGGNNSTPLSQNSSHRTTSSMSQQNSDTVPATATNETSNISECLNVTNLSDVFTGTDLKTSAVCKRGLLKVLPVVLEGSSGKIETFALLDEGSTATLIDGNIATQIGAEITGQQRLRVNGIGGMFLDTEVCYVNFHIRGRNSSDRHLVQGARSITPLHLAPQTTNMINLARYDHLADISDLQTLENATPNAFRQIVLPKN